MPKAELTLDKRSELLDYIVGKWEDFSYEHFTTLADRILQLKTFDWTVNSEAQELLSELNSLEPLILELVNGFTLKADVAFKLQNILSELRPKVEELIQLIESFDEVKSLVVEINIYASYLTRTAKNWKKIQKSFYDLQAYSQRLVEQKSITSRECSSVVRRARYFLQRAKPELDADKELVLEPDSVYSIRGARAEDFLNLENALIELEVIALIRAV